MDWRLKLLGEKAVDVLLPGEFGLSVHYKLQSKMGKVGQMGAAPKKAEIHKALNMACQIEEFLPVKIEGAKILEVGTGWHGTDIQLLYLLGAEEIWTCDHLEHLDEQLVLDVVAGFEPHIADIAEKIGQDATAVQARYAKMKQAKSLDDVKRICNIRYLAPSVFYEAELPDGYFDIFYSYSVLQRLTPPILVQYLNSARQALKPGGFSAHVLHHGDHNARLQKSLGNLDYLRYSDRLYDLLQSKKYNYQNRLRHGEFVQVFVDNGFETVAEDLSRNPPESLSKLRVARRFQHIPVDDLLVTRTALFSRISD